MTFLLTAGRLLTVSYPADPSQTVTYSYDSTAGGNHGVGRLTSLADGSGSTSWVYDALGRVIAEIRVIGTKSYQTTYAYDAADNLVHITSPSGRIVSYSRNSLGQVSMGPFTFAVPQAVRR